MESMYWGIDVSQMIFGAAMVVLLAFFAVWGYRASRNAKTGGTKTGGTKNC